MSDFTLRGIYRSVRGTEEEAGFLQDLLEINGPQGVSIPDLPYIFRDGAPSRSVFRKLTRPPNTYSQFKYECLNYLVHRKDAGERRRVRNQLVDKYFLLIGGTLEGFYHAYCLADEIYRALRVNVLIGRESDFARLADFWQMQSDVYGNISFEMVDMIRDEVSGKFLRRSHSG